jgi:hypothetical protein
MALSGSWISAQYFTFHFKEINFKACSSHLSYFLDKFNASNTSLEIAKHTIIRKEYFSCIAWKSYCLDTVTVINPLEASPPKLWCTFQLKGQILAPLSPLSLSVSLAQTAGGNGGGVTGWQEAKTGKAVEGYEGSQWTSRTLPDCRSVLRQLIFFHNNVIMKWSVQYANKGKASWERFFTSSISITKFSSISSFSIYKFGELFEKNVKNFIILSWKIFFF